MKFPLTKLYCSVLCTKHKFYYFKLTYSQSHAIVYSLISQEVKKLCESGGGTLLFCRLHFLEFWILFSCVWFWINIKSLNMNFNLKKMHILLWHFLHLSIFKSMKWKSILLRSWVLFTSETLHIQIINTISKYNNTLHFYVTLNFAQNPIQFWLGQNCQRSDLDYLLLIYLFTKLMAQLQICYIWTVLW